MNDVSSSMGVRLLCLGGGAGGRRGCSRSCWCSALPVVLKVTLLVSPAIALDTLGLQSFTLKFSLLICQKNLAGPASKIFSSALAASSALAKWSCTFVSLTLITSNSPRPICPAQVFIKRSLRASIGSPSKRSTSSTVKPGLDEGGEASAAAALLVPASSFFFPLDLACTAGIADVAFSAANTTAAVSTTFAFFLFGSGLGASVFFGGPEGTGDKRTCSLVNLVFLKGSISMSGGVSVSGLSQNVYSYSSRNFS
mmetsp:Transcript_8952/g.30828  ORF Transcript_8952/g.30828 Transcript_8952/m.30828 type:complete len:254 (-) Transcript_8952:2047-2808(-)